MELLKKIGKSLIIGTVMGIIIAFLTSKFVPDLINRLEHQSYYMRYQWKALDLRDAEGIEKEDDETGIAIIDIDDRTMQKIGLYHHWNRSYHAEMLNSIKNHFPAAVLFDITFDNPEDHNYKKRVEKLFDRNSGTEITDKGRQSIINLIDYDKQLVQSTKNAGVTYHGVRLASEHDYPDIGKSEVMKKATKEWHENLNPGSCVKFSQEKRQYLNSDKNIIDGVFPELAQSSKAIGLLNMHPNEDGYIREVPLMYSFGKNAPVYLSLSVRCAISLFGTPNEEVVFEPGRYLDIGTPFKIRKTKKGDISFSYPNLTVSQVKAIISNSKEILNLEPGKSLEVSTLLTIGRYEDGEEYVAMYCGDLPKPVIEALTSSELEKLTKLEVGSSIELSHDISISRDSDVEWILSAPYGDEEWYLAENDFSIISRLDINEFDSIEKGQSKLVFYNFIVRNKGGILKSTIPVLRGKTLKELCQLDWSEIENLKPGSRLDIGQNVRIPLTKDNEHIVTYFGKRKEPFRYLSYYDIMKDRIQGELAGKIFLVGSTVSGLFDIVSVPIQNIYPGVEVHASLINSFITNTFVRRLEPWQDFVILLLVGIIIGIFGYFLRPLASSILTFISVIGYFLFAMIIFGSDYIWIEIARPVLTIILTYTAVMAYRYITEEKDRKFLQSTFKQYLSPELIDAMYKNKQMPKLGGDEGVRTAYFTDIQSFSTFSEKLGSPTRLVELLNEYLTEMTDSLLEHYGTLDKYEGDAIIAFYGAPMPMEDHAQQACLTALDMQYRLGELRKKWASEGGKWPEIVHDMRMRIGINTGAITTGNMGSAVRMNYTMMGDAVNLAARLESAAKMYGIYSMISKVTYDIVKEDFAVRQVDKITVVGKSEPVVVYELMGKKGKLDAETEKLVEIYLKGLGLFYEQKWDGAIETLTKSEKMEPFKEAAPGGMSPSRKIIQYCEMFKAEPPGDDWDGVIRLTTK